MTKQMKLALAVTLLIGSVSMQAQQPQPAVSEMQTVSTTSDLGGGQTAHKKKKAVAKKKVAAKPVEKENTLAREVRELREKQATQQAQIDSLTQANAAKDAALAAAQSSAADAQATAQAATAQAQSVSATVQANKDDVQALKGNVADMQTMNAGLVSTISANKVELADKIDSPSTLHYKGVTITPVAYFALEGVYRQRSINSDINTPFNTTPFPGSNEAKVSEFNFSGRQSRLGGLFEGNAGTYKLSGYFEADFLSAGTTSNSNQSNSYTLRQRQIWGKGETKSGFAITGGQTWSLLTETGKSTDTRTEKLPNTIDPQYMVGFTWARQPTIRIQQKFTGATAGNALTLAMSVEQAQITNFNATNAPGNFFFAGAGTGGGLFNPGGFNGATNYANNIAPDVIVKMAADTKRSHFEIAGVARFFRERYYPAIGAAATGYVAQAGAVPYNLTTVGGGVVVNGRVTVDKYLDLAISGMGGDGIGRYGSSQLADATVRPNGMMVPVRNYHGQFSIEMHPTPKLDTFAYYGGEYAQRTVYATGIAASPFTGYAPTTTIDTGCSTEGAPAGNSGGTPAVAANCNAVTRYIQEGMIGFTYRVVNSPKFGRLQYSATYSYLERSAWTGITAGTLAAPTAFGGPKAVNNMIHIGMRYYIP